MNLTGLHLLLTYRCTFECDHCFVYSSPRAEGTLSLRLSKEAIRQAAELGTVREIWFEGGEPFLYFPILRALVEAASFLGLRTGIVTNAYYAESVEDAAIWLAPLKAAGLTMLSVSDDSYHSDEFPHSTSVKNLVDAARELHIDTDTICIEGVGQGTKTNEKGEPITGGTVRFRGRAVEKLAGDQTATLPWHSFDSCPDEDWEDLGRLHLDGYGKLFACQGIVLGNLLQSSLAEVVANYRPENHPIIGPLHRGGPAELVRHFDLPLKDKYLDACHLCFLSRRQLLERFPRELAPAQVYGIEPKSD
jgi:hypothetical protein